jgi:GR25 family glycosyltransferase involved in LPS biosynthesis
MTKAGLKFEIFPCVKMTHVVLEKAIHEGWLGQSAEQGDLKSTGVLGVALAHKKLWHHIAMRNLSAANIFEDDEVVYDTYAIDRARVLSDLPSDAEFVNLNPSDPRGDPIPGADPLLHKMGKGIPMWSNIWLSNYYVSRDGAKKLLAMTRDYAPSLTNEQIDWHIVRMISAGCFSCRIKAYSYGTNALSAHCHTTSVKETYDRQKMAASILQREPVEPVCLEGSPEGTK